MSKASHAFFLCKDYVKRTFAFTGNQSAGKVTLFTVVGATVAVAIGSFAFFDVNVSTVSADDVTTSVTVLNTPPVWTIDAEESTESSTTTPTNSGAVLSFVGTATDSNNDNYFLLICKTSGTPTASSNAPPACNGGVSNQWARSATTTSGAQATASTSTKETFPFNFEANHWYAWVCDANASLARCNATFKQGSGATASPFVINHPPTFISVSNDGPVLPGIPITWTTVASDTDAIRGADTLALFVCKAADFTGSDCGVGGSWASTTYYALNNPQASTTIAIPTQDKQYSAFVYVIDFKGRTATSSQQGFNSAYYVSNATPSVTAATISLVDTDNSGNLTLLTPHASTTGFKVQFEVTDNNSCLNASSTREIGTTTINVYRSSVTQAACMVSGDYNSNSCYTAQSSLFPISCTQDVASCSGASDVSATWTCTHTLWYNADPTDASTQYTADNWLASVQAYDNNYATSTLTESTTGNELSSFLAFDVSSTSISFGALEPGQQNDPLATTTDLLAYGNVGLDEDLYGDTMCTTWTTADSCDVGGVNAGTKIPVSNQKFATSSVAYAAGNTLTSSTSPTLLLINVPKTTATSSPQTKNTWWGINIPSAITLAGNYSGQNTITAIKSDPTNW